MTIKKISSADYSQCQAGIHSLACLADDLLFSVNKNEAKNRVARLLKQLNEKKADLYRKLVFHEFIRAPNRSSYYFDRYIRPLIDKSLKARVWKAADREDIQQNIVLKLMTAKPVFPENFRAYLSTLISHEISSFYNTEIKQKELSNYKKFFLYEDDRLVKQSDAEVEIIYLYKLIGQSGLTENEKLFSKLYLEGKTRTEIIRELKIGETTYDRYKKKFRNLVNYYSDQPINNKFS